MVRIKRIAAVAVIGISLALGATLAAPSQAEEAVSAASVSYTEHAAAAPVLSAVATQNLDNELPKADVGESLLPAPVATHAVATLEPVQQADTPAANAAKPLNALVLDYAASETTDAELECLATAVYFESKSEPLAGQLAVAEVIINRTQSGRFPKSLCGVVKQRGQFSFVRGGRLPSVPRASAFWKTAVAIAQIARQDLSESKAPSALYFHARRVSPGWRLTKVAAVGNHVFYR
jgi:N-acetylmuramoyl-L-alanine amidase